MQKFRSSDVPHGPGERKNTTFGTLSFLSIFGYSTDQVCDPHVAGSAPGKKSYEIMRDIQHFIGAVDRKLVDYDLGTSLSFGMSGSQVRYQADGHRKRRDLLTIEEVDEFEKRACRPGPAP